MKAVGVAHGAESTVEAGRSYALLNSRGSVQEAVTGRVVNLGYRGRAECERRLLEARRVDSGVKLQTLETVRAELLATNAMLAAYAREGGCVPIGIELFCINLARCVHQLCGPKHDLWWLVQIPANTLPGMVFLVQEAARQLDACGPSRRGFRPPTVRATVWRRTSHPTAEESRYADASTAPE